MWLFRMPPSARSPYSHRTALGWVLGLPEAEVTDRGRPTLPFRRHCTRFFTAAFSLAGVQVKALGQESLPPERPGEKQSHFCEAPTIHPV